MLCNACHIYLKYVEQNKSKDIFFHHYYNNTVKIIIVIYNFKSLRSQFNIVSFFNGIKITVYYLLLIKAQIMVLFTIDFCIWQYLSYSTYGWTNPIVR